MPKKIIPWADLTQDDIEQRLNALETMAVGWEHDPEALRHLMSKANTAIMSLVTALVPGSMEDQKQELYQRAFEVGYTAGYADAEEDLEE